MKIRIKTNITYIRDFVRKLTDQIPHFDGYFDLKYNDNFKQSLSLNLYLPETIAVDKRNNRPVKVIGDDYDRFFLAQYIKMLYILISRVRLHSAMVEKKSKGVLILGAKGQGKTTLSNLISKKKGYKIIDDDVSSLIQEKNNVKLISKKETDNLLATYIKPCILIHIKKSLKEKSSVKLMPAGDMFKKLIFLSEFPPADSDFQHQAKLSILEKVAKQCKCYEFTNGKDLFFNQELILKQLGI